MTSMECVSAVAGILEKDVNPAMGILESVSRLTAISGVIDKQRRRDRSADMKMTAIRCSTYGLCKWGGGMNPEAREKWHGFWASYKGIHWHALYDGATYLVSAYGGGMIHSVDFTLLVRAERERVRADIAELDDAMGRLAKELGFTYSLGTQELYGEAVGPYEEYTTPERGECNGETR